MSDIDRSCLGQLKALVSNEIAPIKFQNSDPGEQYLEAVCAVIGYPYAPPKGYSPLRRWLREERVRDLDEGMRLPGVWDGPSIAFGPRLLASDRICAAVRLEDQGEARMLDETAARIRARLAPSDTARGEPYLVINIPT